jgi:acyl carrier protein
MNTEDIRHGVDDVLRRFMRALPAGAPVAADASLRDDLKIDSADMIEIALELEEHFEISVPEEEMNQVRTPAHIVRLVERIGRANGALGR